MMDVSRFVICDPWRALALAVIHRAVLDAAEDDPVPGDEKAPGAARRDALRFLRAAAAGEPEEAWFHLAELEPGLVLEAVAKREEARRAAGKVLVEQGCLEALEELLTAAPLSRPGPEPGSLPPRKPAGRKRFEQERFFDYSQSSEVAQP